MGPFTYESRKNRASHILFVEKRGLIIYLAALKKGGGGWGIRHAHPYYAIYRKLPHELHTNNADSEQTAWMSEPWLDAHVSGYIF